MDALVTRKTSQSHSGAGSSGVPVKPPSPHGGVESAGEHAMGTPNTVFPKMCSMQPLSLGVIFIRQGFPGHVRLQDAACPAWRVTVYINDT